MLHRCRDDFFEPLLYQELKHDLDGCVQDLYSGHDLCMRLDHHGVHACEDGAVCISFLFLLTDRLGKEWHSLCDLFGDPDVLIFNQIAAVCLVILGDFPAESGEGYQRQRLAVCVCCMQRILELQCSTPNHFYQDLIREAVHPLQDESAEVDTNRNVRAGALVIAKEQS